MSRISLEVGSVTDVTLSESAFRGALLAHVMGNEGERKTRNKRHDGKEVKQREEDRRKGRGGQPGKEVMK